MSDRSQTDRFDVRIREVPEPFAPLPSWLAARLLRDDENVTWVYGPRFNPSWERYVTHPALFVVALVVGVACIWLGWQYSGPPRELPRVPCLIGGGLIFGSIFVLAFSSGYFTRLVVTNYRLLILQGYGVCRIWDINDLPISLIRYRQFGDEPESRTIDLDALKTMLGGPTSDKVVDSRAILKFGQHLEKYKGRENGQS